MIKVKDFSRVITGVKVSARARRRAVGQPDYSYRLGHLGTATVPCLDWLNQNLCEWDPGINV